MLPDHALEDELKCRVRASDPLSSVLAAEGSLEFSASHKARIFRALKDVDNATAHELTKATGLTVVQIDRRLPELRRDGLADVVQAGSIDCMRDNYRVWTAKKICASEQQKVANET